MRETRQVRRTGLRRHPRNRGSMCSHTAVLLGLCTGEADTQGKQARWKATEQAGPWGPEDALSLAMKEE